MQADCPFNVSLGLSGAETSFNEGSTCLVTAAFFDAAGSPFTPTSVEYRVDDINSGAPIVSLTAVTPLATTASITVTGAQNQLLSDLRSFEEHQLTIEVEDSYGNTMNAAIRWCVQRIFPSITE